MTINTYAEFMAEAEALDPEGFAKARAERAELEALRKDAERYRKLRTAALRSIIGPVPTLAGYVNGKYTGEHRALLGGELDELVDAMQAVGAA